VQNVTTYEAIIDVMNPGLLLKPGMTANIKVQVARRDDVLRVPNAALRFRPAAEIFAALNQPPPPTGLPTAGGRAWVYVDNVLKPVTVGVGITDGVNTELLSGDLQAGAKLATGVVVAAPTVAAAGGTANPLMGQPRGGGPGRGF
jgi:HlyD family secretion protein